jgi:hypothetical protein
MTKKRTLQVVASTPDIPEQVRKFNSWKAGKLSAFGYVNGLDGGLQEIPRSFAKWARLRGADLDVMVIEYEGIPADHAAMTSVQKVLSGRAGLDVWKKDRILAVKFKAPASDRRRRAAEITQLINGKANFKWPQIMRTKWAQLITIETLSAGPPYRRGVVPSICKEIYSGDPNDLDNDPKRVVACFEELKNQVDGNGDFAHCCAEALCRLEFADNFRHPRKSPRKR